MASRSKQQNWIAWVGVIALAIVIVSLALLLQGRFNVKISADTSALDQEAQQAATINTQKAATPASTVKTPATPTDNTSEATNAIKLTYTLKFDDCINTTQPPLSAMTDVVIDGVSKQGQLSGDTINIDTGLTTNPKQLSFTISGYDPVIITDPATKNKQTVTLKKTAGKKGLCTDEANKPIVTEAVLTLKLSVRDCPADYRIDFSKLQLISPKTKYTFDEISQTLYIPMTSIAKAQSKIVEVAYLGNTAVLELTNTDSSITKNLALKPLNQKDTIECGNSSDQIDTFTGVTKAITNQITAIRQTEKEITNYQRLLAAGNWSGMSGNYSVLLQQAQLKRYQQLQRLSYLENTAKNFGVNYTSPLTDPTQMINNGYQSLINSYGNNNTYNPYTQRYGYDSSNPFTSSFGNNSLYTPDGYSSNSNNTLFSPYQVMSPKCILAPTIANKIGTLLEKIPKVGSILSTIANIFGLSYAYKNCSGYASYNNNSFYGNDNYNNGNYDNYGNSSFSDNYSNNYYPYADSYSPYSSVSNPSSSLSIILSGPLGNLKTQLGRLPLGSAEMNNIWRWYMDAKNNSQYGNNSY